MLRNLDSCAAWKGDRYASGGAPTWTRRSFPTLFTMGQDFCIVNLDKKRSYLMGKLGKSIFDEWHIDLRRSLRVLSCAEVDASSDPDSVKFQKKVASRAITISASLS